VYADSGSYVVKLTVTDDEGATGSVEQQLTVTANIPPVPAFTHRVTNGNVVEVDATSSTDPDGAVDSYFWDFGDGASSSEETVSHSYEAAGSYSIMLTVRDDDGATASVTKEVVVEGTNQAPIAAFTVVPDGDFRAAFDASASSDPDGSVAAFAWDFGDGTTGQGQTISHTFLQAGTYTVTLTVQDNRGGSAQSSQEVRVNGPFAVDTFTRTVTGGWGQADVGGGWTRTGSATLFGVSEGIGSVRTATAGSGSAIHLNDVASSDTDLALRFSVDKVANGGGQFVSVTGRGAVNDGYRAKAQVSSSGAVTISLVRATAGAETTLASRLIPGLTIQAATDYSLRLQVWGSSPTNLRAKLWSSLEGQPPGWDVVATDTTAALQGPGAIGVRSYLSGSATNAPTVVRFDDITARTTGN
jgi:PKD repeat protein